MRSGDIIEFDPWEHFVYELLDDRGEVFYVGKSNNPQGRLYAHWRGTGNAEVTAKLRSLLKPRMRIVYGPVNEQEALVLEREEIYKPGRKLLNVEHRPNYRNPHEGKKRLIDYLRTASKCQ